jgi:hypothetical protein
MARSSRSCDDAIDPRPPCRRTGRPIPTFAVTEDAEVLFVAGCEENQARFHPEFDRARKNLDRHPNYILAAYMASGTRPALKHVARSCMPM